MAAAQLSLAFALILIIYEPLELDGHNFGIEIDNERNHTLLACQQTAT